MNKNSSWETSVKPVVVLSVIALIVSLLLAMVNSFTAPRRPQRWLPMWT